MKDKREGVSGFLLIDKPAGISSFDVIRSLRKLTSIRKIGHTGTLDPFANGMMIYSLNRYTRLCNLLESADKTYHVQMQLGVKTDSGDNTGNIVQTCEPDIDETRLVELKTAVLAINKLPIPQYSAVKIDGKRAYEYARKNEYVDIPDRDVHILEFDVIACETPYLTYNCRVSKGTYIRSLSEWIANYLGSIGHTIELRRTAINTISVSDCVPLAELNEQNWQEHLYPPHKLFEGYQSIQLDADEISELTAGRAVTNEGEDADQILVFDFDLSIRSVVNRRAAKLYPKMNLV